MCRGSVGILTASFGTFYPKADLLLRGSDHLLKSFFFFFFQLWQKQSEFESFLSPVPLNTTAITFIVRNYTISILRNGIIFWDVSFVWNVKVLCIRMCPSYTFKTLFLGSDLRGYRDIIPRSDSMRTGASLRVSAPQLFNSCNLLNAIL